MLKIKGQLHYKRGYTDRSCSDCNHYEESFKLTGINGEDLGHGPRCGIIGLKPGRMYRINPKNICDKFDNSELLSRLRADRWK